MNKPITSYSKVLLSALIILISGNATNAQTTAFTYQGKLTDNGNPANGQFDFQFKLFDTQAVGTGTQQGSNVNVANVTVTNGNFSVQLDFDVCASCFNGAARFLEIAVKPTSSGTFTTLGPRQPLTSSPYAIQTLNATQLGGLPASRYVAADTNGKVGIGTVTPSTKLEVVDPVRQLRFGPTTADNGGYLISTAPHQAIIIGGAKFDGTNWIARDTVASMTAHQFGAIEFYTNDGLTVGNPFSPAQRMSITTGGNVGIGTDAPVAKLHVNGSTSGDGVRGVSINGDGVRGDSTSYAGVSGYSINGSGVFGSSNYLAGYFQGNVYVTGTVTQGSDARLKQGISTLGYGLSEVLRLRPVSWRWKDHPERGQQLGLVAQEVEPVLPELVSTTKDAEQTKGLNYTGLLPVLVKAIQEQQARIEQQRQQLKKQRTQIERQQREIGELRQAVKALKPSLHNRHRK